ncbi:hypothetical protein [Megasphaera sp. NM10]|nr:hypothetical protein [Megasphaera sp. NM10]
MSKLTHRIEKKAVEILVDRIMAERNPADRQKKLKTLILCHAASVWRPL